MQTKYNEICSALTGATDRNNDQCGKDMQVIAQKKHKQNRGDPVTQSCRIALGRVSQPVAEVCRRILHALALFTFEVYCCLPPSWNRCLLLLQQEVLL